MASLVIKYGESMPIAILKMQILHKLYGASPKDQHFKHYHLNS